MAYVHSGARPAGAAFDRFLTIIARWRDGRHDRATMRRTLKSLDCLDAEQLADLGLERQDLKDARGLQSGIGIGLLYRRRFRAADLELG